MHPIRAVLVAATLMIGAWTASLDPPLPDSATTVVVAPDAPDLAVVDAGELALALEAEPVDVAAVPVASLDVDAPRPRSEPNLLELRRGLDDDGRNAHSSSSRRGGAFGRYTGAAQIPRG